MSKNIIINEKDIEIDFYGPFVIKYLDPETARIIQRSKVPYEIKYRYHQQKDDDLETHLIVSQKILGNGRYRSDKFQILSKYVTIEIEFPQGYDRPDFYIEVFDLKSKEVAFSEKEEENERSFSFDSERGSGPLGSKLSSGITQINEIIKTDTRSKSPFKRLFQNSTTKRNSVTTLTSSDRGIPTVSKMEPCRLPPLVLENCLLIGDKNNHIKAISRPHVAGLYLMSTEDGVEWTLPFPPVHK